MGAGTIIKIRLENFMCHSNQEVVLGENVNFVTGQNGSGKSAILTALCVAFGCRAARTQRASTLKDFIKTGCSYTVVQVDITNEGDDAFKPEMYGDVITIERRITVTSNNTTTLKDSHGKKVSNKKGELLELVEHFNIDVENPCVIMSQDKSREFLHSGNDKDKFKFFYKASLLQQVNDLLQSIEDQIDCTNEKLDELEASIKPIEKELKEIQEKIKGMEHVEQLSQQLELVRKKLAWSWVYDVDKQIQEQSARIEKFKEREQACQARINKISSQIELYHDQLAKKKAQIAVMLEKTSEVKRMKSELEQSVSKATKTKHELEEEHGRGINSIKKMQKRIGFLEQQALEIHEQHARDMQAEESEIMERMTALQHEVDEINSAISRLKEEESALSDNISKERYEIRTIKDEVDDCEKKHREITDSIRQLQRNQTNKVTAFGGDKVLSLLRAIERQHRSFSKPPIGPIGAHLTLVDGDTWAPAVEQAVGRLLNAFIVDNHKDSLVLKRCAKEVNYNNLQILIYDFSRPRLNMPPHMLPQTRHPTTYSVLNSDSHIVLNVLVDMGSVERQVLVQNYDAGKAVAFDQRVSNLKEVYTLDGYKMFSRGSVQTVLPPNKRARGGRLCGSYDDQIKALEREAAGVREEVEHHQRRKRKSEGILDGLQNNLDTVKRRRLNVERQLTTKNLELKDVKSSFVAEEKSTSASTVDELQHEISKIQDEIQEKEYAVDKIRVKMNEAEAKAEELKLSFKDLCDSAKVEIDAFENAEKQLMDIENNINSKEGEKAHYEGIMNNKVLPDIKTAEDDYQELVRSREENFKKASVICPETEVEAFFGELADNSPEKLSALLKRLKQSLQQESQRCSESIDDLRMLYDKKQRKIARKQQNFTRFRENVKTVRNAMDLRWQKFKRNETLLRQQLTWKFNGHLGKKGIFGRVKVDYEEKTLSVEVKMPQDASRGNVRDTRGLSGGERSFSTLCFALALHEMTEAPFRAMDEFDVFMDAVSRKISLDTLLDFAVSQGSQWILITPHDISMVKHDPKVKKLQMAAPRS
ncbi:LOW QUALITY PROTEIN: structural maintenance of chromosomes protein 6B-like [Rutidosis leptorrhynchoides]|uniref:LOW QUALITY PROTEIN: structural maintenance of chromosomes protein 6B-like n=1 Tax=Rutidosis leptorrhynchoides TaxID=125765 RepID=UPI003A98DAB4